VILYSLAELLLEFTSFAVLDFLCDFVLTNSWKRTRILSSKTCCDFHSSGNILLLFIFYSYY